MPEHWTVELYTKIDGSCPLVEFIEEQSISNQAKVFHELEDLAEFGLMPRGKAKHLEGKLWELRFRAKEVSIRLIYFAHTGRRFVVLHGFCKKTQKTPKKELRVAQRRLQDYLDRQSQK